MVTHSDAGLPYAPGEHGGSFRPRNLAVPLLLLVLSAPATAQEIWVPTGPPESRAEVPGETANWAALFDPAQYEEFANMTRGRGPTLNELPPLSDAAKFGYVFYFAEQNRHFVVDAADDGGYVLYADVNANDNLLDDQPRDLEPRNGLHTTRFLLSATETREGQEHTYPVRLQLYIKPTTDPNTGEETLQFWWDGQTLRYGTIQVGDTVAEFAVFGRLGLYGDRHNEVWFDLDGDGRGVNDRRSDERFRVRDEIVTIDGHAYRFSVDRYGRHLILEPRGRGTARPSVAIGSLAPDFLAQDVDGLAHRLSDYRGRVVLLDFYAAWCGPCNSEAWLLADLYRDYHDRGLVILGITPDDPAAIRSFRERYDHHWPLIQDGSEAWGGELHRSYRVVGYPTHYVVGKDGTIIGGRIDWDTFEGELRQALDLPD